MGVLILTNYRVLFLPKEKDSQLPVGVNYESGVGSPLENLYREYRYFPRSEYVEIPISSIYKMEKSSKKTMSYQSKLAVIYTFDCRKMSISFRGCINERQIFFIELFKLLPKAYNDLFSVLIGNIVASTRRFDRLSTYDGFSVFNKMITQQNKSHLWRISSINETFELCESYPVHLVVPSSINDSELMASSKFRMRGRIPVVSWINPRNNSVLIRSSLPLIDRCSEDEKLLNAYGSSNATSSLLYIIDTRVKTTVVGDVTKRAGIESSTFYKNTKMLFMECNTASQSKESWLKLVDLFQENKRSDNWYSLLENTKWLYYIQKILSNSAKIANIIERRGNSVLIHCKYGWNATPQLTSLVQIMLSHEFRTIRGFQNLIEREWLAFGHPFSSECGQYYINPVNNSTENNENEQTGEFSKMGSRISFSFIQFLDCVWQLTQIYPTYFDFNEQFLIAISNAVYNGLYGTFLCSTESERYLLSVKSRTLSLWTDIMTDLKKYQNPFYSCKKKIMIPMLNHWTLSLWTSNYNRYCNSNATESIEDKYIDLLQENYELRKTIANIRNKG